MPAFWIILVCSFLLGLIFGSFLNVCIVRLPAGESVVQPRSHCRSCKHTLVSSQNIPVLSWLLLRGRCRFCNMRIAAQYPLIELATGLWFALAAGISLPATAIDFAGVIHALSLCALGFFLIGLAVMDWQTSLLPNEFTVGGMLLGLFLAACQSFAVPPIPTKTFFTPEETFIGQRIFAAAGAFLLLFLIDRLYRLLRKRQGIGLGDAKMLALIAAFLGFQLTVFALALGVFAATLYAVPLLLRRRAHAATRLPFGSFLAIGGLLSSILGSQAVDWYTSLLQ